MKLEFIPVKKQSVWKTPAVANFVLGGGGAGFYLIDALTSLMSPPGSDRSQMMQPGWVSMLMVGLGFLSIAFEAGRPWRAGYVFNRLCTSWMSREAFLAVLFMLFSGWNLWSPHPLLNAAAAVCAMGFIVCQGFILFSSRAVQSWNTFRIPTVMAVSSVYAGCGLNLINDAASGSVSQLSLMMGILAGAASLGVGFSLLGSAAPEEPKPLNAASWRKSSRAIILIAGHAVPLVLMALCMVLAGAITADALRVILAGGAGAGILIGSSIQKEKIVQEMGMQMGICLNYGVAGLL